MIDIETKEKLIDIARRAIYYGDLPLDSEEIYFMDCDNEYYAENITYQMGKEVTTNCGASKFVIIPFDLDYVIKIPFNYYCVDYEEWQEYGEIPEEIEEDNDAVYDYYCDLISSSDKEVLRKLTGAYDKNINPSSNWDYCAKETNTYQAAIKAGIEMFFAPEELLFYYNNYPIYVQTKCIDYYDSDISLIEEKDKKITMNKIKSDKRFQYWDIVDYDWAALAERFYGYGKLAHFYDFIVNYCISDLDYKNFGVIAKTGAPCLIDYSGYES